MENVFVRQPQQRQMRDQVFEAILDAIRSLRLRPGQRLREAELEEQLGVSKTPIREAFVRLEQLDLVTIEKYKGAVVRGYTPADLVEVYELRELLEGACARTAARGMSDDDRTALERVVNTSERAHLQNDMDAVIRLFDEFDEILIRQTNNRRMSDLLSALSHHMVRIGLLTVKIPGRVDVSLEQHRAIYEAIVAGDARESEELMRHHVRSVLNDHLSNEVSLSLLEADEETRT